MNKLPFGFAILVSVLFSCTGKEKAEDDSVWMKKGDSLIVRTFDTLRNTLMNAVKEKGFAGAVSFCNIEATRLTNMYAGEGISIKRSSDKLRNPANAPDSTEQRILLAFLELKKENRDIIPVLEKDAAGNHHFYKPIMIQAMCLNCHGDRLTLIKPDVWSVIQQKYPGDSAFNYKEGDLRGIWHVSFTKN
jgi:hypothetical protein